MVYIVYQYGDTCAIIVAHAMYVYAFWKELGYSHLESVSYHWKSLKVFFKWNHALRFLSTIQSSERRYYSSESKPILYLNAVHCKFSLCVKSRKWPV